MTIPFFLTEQEKKKMRRKKRLEKEKEKQEKVSLGLMPVPAPRVTMSNYLRVMTKEAIADPSKCEKEVKKIVAKRVQDHLNRNEAGKLTREQKEEKMKRKANRDYDKDAKIALFKIAKVALQAQLKFKVTMNAQQLHLGGLCMIADPHLAPNLPHLIVVEGGPHAIK
jgi:U4/U6 small nuclear ribonucleoprotein PRP3